MSNTSSAAPAIRRSRKTSMSAGSSTMAELDRQKIEADWASHGFSCELWTDPPGQCWENFRHATDEG